MSTEVFRTACENTLSLFFGQKAHCHKGAVVFQVKFLCTLTSHVILLTKHERPRTFHPLCPSSSPYPSPSQTLTLVPLHPQEVQNRANSVQCQASSAPSARSASTKVHTYASFCRSRSRHHRAHHRRHHHPRLRSRHRQNSHRHHLRRELWSWGHG